MVRGSNAVEKTAESERALAALPWFTDFQLSFSAFSA